MKRQQSAWKGILAGMAGGVVAAWVMNVFIAGPGATLQEAIKREEPNGEQPEHSRPPKEDATVKAADAITHTVTGEHLTHGEKATGGPAVHYAFGALTGGVYGGLAEVIPSVTSGFGTGFGGFVFSTADLLAVPAFELGPWPSEQPKSALATPFAAHLVYGATTELVRRITRRLLG